MNRERLSPIAVDVDSRCIAAVQVARSGSSGQWRIKAATMIERTGKDGFMDDSEITRLADVLGRQGFHGDRIVLAVPCDKLLTGILEVPPIGSGAPLDQIARMELARMHKCDPGAMELAYWNLPSRARAGDGAEVIAAACLIDSATAVLDSFERREFDVEALDVHGWAMVRACRPLISSPEKVAAVLDWRWDSAVLALVHQDMIVYERTLAELGLNRLAEGLAAQSGPKPEIAEFILLEGGVIGPEPRQEPAPRIVEEAQSPIVAHIESLIREVQTSCTYVGHRYANASADRLLLLGPGAAMPGAAELFTRRLNLDVKSVAPNQLAQCADSLMETCRGTALTLAFGLAQHAGGDA